jgi:hypothetical protein
MQIIKTAYHSCQYSPDQLFISLYKALLHQRAQIRALQQLHHYVLVNVINEVVNQFNDVDMVQAFHDLNLIWHFR